MQLYPHSVKNEAIALYRSGIGLPSIEKRLDIYQHTLCYWFRKAGIMRSRTEASLLPKHWTKVPPSFTFVPLTPSTAWLLGLIFSDGSMTNQRTSINISVGDADVDGIDKISRVAGGRLSAWHYPGCYRVTLSSSFIWRQLNATYGLHPNKSLAMQWPPIPSTMLSHFVRGLYDGDGSWYMRKERKSQSLKSSYASCSGRFVESLRDCLAEQIGLRTSKTVREAKRNDKIFNGYRCSDYFVLELGHVDSVNLGHWLYAESESIRYERKYEIWSRLQRPSRRRF